MLLCSEFSLLSCKYFDRVTKTLVMPSTNNTFETLENQRAHQKLLNTFQSIYRGYEKKLTRRLQVLTNQFLSNIRSSIPVLQYLFVNVLPY